MEEFVWKSSFDTGIEKIDAEHQHLLKLLNEVHADLTSAQGVCEELQDYAESHFFNEEEMMLSSSYPELLTHQQWHRFFEEQVTQLEKAIGSGEGKSTASLITFLRDWILNHILLEDKKFAHYLQAHFKEDDLATFLAEGS
ncbi:MAG: bacteriohemerythrin [Desulfuromonadales bacterium]|jgi:hemerythrin